MGKFNVAERFVSINGEGRRAGQPAVFIRFRGCNLRCSYCDTMWANGNDCPAEQMSAEEILQYIKETGIENVTLTGGEPLIQEGVHELIEMLLKNKLYVEIETNGSVDISEYKTGTRPSFTLDYKTPSSGMEEKMLMSNYEHLEEQDTVKFVCGSNADLETARKIIENYSLQGKCAVYISPVFGKIEPAEIVEFMLKNKMNKVNFQLQLHKFIWDPDKKGV